MLFVVSNVVSHPDTASCSAAYMIGSLSSDFEMVNSTSVQGCDPAFFTVNVKSEWPEPFTA